MISLLLRHRRRRRSIDVCLAQEFAKYSEDSENIQRILNKISNSIFCTGRSSIDFRKTKTRVITTAIQSEANHYLEPMRTQIENKLRTNGIRFYFRLSVGNCSLKSYFRLSHRQTCLFILITALQFIPLYSVLWI